MPEVEVVWPLAPAVDRARRCEAGLPRPHQHLAIECVQKPKMLEFGEDDQRRGLGNNHSISFGAAGYHIAWVNIGVNYSWAARSILIIVPLSTIIGP